VECSWHSEIINQHRFLISNIGIMYIKLIKRLYWFVLISFTSTA